MNVIRERRHIFYCRSIVEIENNKSAIILDCSQDFNDPVATLQFYYPSLL